ncbi:hypothetical protein ACIOD1_07030 [Streptomyces sp. NPDC088097]|uniref:hypothetical protein n=1 Tax=Streptomyces sp. NPDC088097 TaxID=3365823 RepID=UPI0038145B90
MTTDWHRLCSLASLMAVTATSASTRRAIARENSAATTSPATGRRAATASRM